MIRGLFLTLFRACKDKKLALHRAGGKLTKSHTTVIDAVAPLVDQMQDIVSIRKISLGIIKQVGKGTPSIKIYPISAGLRLVVRGNTSIQELVVYTSNPEGVQYALLNK